MRIERLEGKVLGIIQAASGRKASGKWTALALLLTAGLGTLQALSAATAPPTVLYLLPVGLAALLSGKLPGYLTAVAAAVIGEAAGILAGGRPVPALAECGDILANSLLYMVFALLAGTLKDVYAAARSAARTDGLTGLPNARAFGESVGREIERCRRFKHPFTLAHIGCDNMGSVSGRLGPASAEGLIRLAAEAMRATLRSTDLVARVEDEEFAALLTETDSQAAALAMDKLTSRLGDILTSRYPELTFSIGLISFSQCPYTPREVLDMGEMAMFEARRLGRPVRVAK